MSLENRASAENSSLSDASYTVSVLKDINNEMEQISKLSALEKKYVHDLSEILKELMKVLKISFTLSRETIKNIGINASKVCITRECGVKIYSPSRQVKTVELHEMAPSSIISIFSALMPSLERAAELKRAKIGSRSNIIERMIKELKDLLSAS